jgi:hypothetical protein
MLKIRIGDVAISSEKAHGTGRVSAVVRGHRGRFSELRQPFTGGRMSGMRPLSVG